MIEFIFGAAAGSVVGVIATHLVGKYLAKVEADTLTAEADAEALKQSVDAEVATIEKII